jgi:DNA-binding transcriptional LysR family regulator
MTVDIHRRLPFVNTEDIAMNLSNVDLDLFVVLQAVLEEGSATRAAARLHVTRPAVSNALARLRRLLNDQLVVRTARGLVPTPRAKAIAPFVTSALEQLRSVIEDATVFDPRSSTRRFTIASSDNEQLSVLPAVIEAFRRELPRASLRISGIDQVVVGDGLGTGDVDVMIGALPSVPPSLRAVVLFSDRLVCIARRGHTAFRGGRVTSERLWGLPHVDIALLGGRTTFGSGMRDAIETREGRTRSIALTAPNFLSAALAVARTDWLATLPATLAASFSTLLPIQILEIPFETPPIPTQLVWHARSETDAGAVALRRLIRCCAAEIAESAKRVQRRGRRSSR